MATSISSSLPCRYRDSVRHCGKSGKPRVLAKLTQSVWIGLAILFLSCYPVLGQDEYVPHVTRQHALTSSVADLSFTLSDSGRSGFGLVAYPFALSQVLQISADATVVQPWTGELQNVRTAGAIGDGQHDDTEAIRKCIARGGAILFPPGTYRITQPLEVTLSETGWISFHGFGTARLLMAGPGPAIRIRGSHTGSADPKRVHPGVWQRERCPLIDGLEIVGEHPEACGIEAIQTMQLTVVKTLIRQTYHGIRLHQRNRNVLLSHCHIYENRGVGVFLDDVDLHQINVVGCHISYNAAGGIVVKKGYLRNLQITGCDIEANMSTETEPTANILIDSRESLYGHAEIAIAGCTIQHYSKVPGSCNVRFFGQDAKGRLWGNLTIADNVLSDVERNIEIIGARGVSIMGNTFWGAVAEDLLVTGSQNIVIGPNSFDQNPNYAAQGPYQGGVTLQECRDCVITGLQLAGIRASQAALFVQNCHGLNITNCQLTDCLPAGIHLDQVTDTRVSGCIIRTGTMRPEENTGDVTDGRTETGTAIRGSRLENVMICGNLTRGEIDIPNAGVKFEGNLTLPPMP